MIAEFILPIIYFSLIVSNTNVQQNLCEILKIDDLEQKYHIQKDINILSIILVILVPLRNVVFFLELESWIFFNLLKFVRIRQQKVECGGVVFFAYNHEKIRFVSFPNNDVFIHIKYFVNAPQETWNPKTGAGSNIFKISTHSSHNQSFSSASIQIST